MTIKFRHELVDQVAVPADGGPSWEQIPIPDVGRSRLLHVVFRLYIQTPSSGGFQVMLRGQSAGYHYDVDTAILTDQPGVIREYEKVVDPLTLDELTLWYRNTSDVAADYFYATAHLIA